MQDRGKIAVLIPVFNDWNSLNHVLTRLNEVLAENNYRGVHIVIVDDASSAPWEIDQEKLRELAVFEKITVLRLSCNLGSQRAIAIGLAHVATEVACDALVVMDADGEDKPEDVPRLLKAFTGNPQMITVARRRKRTEPLLFRLFYLAYKTLFRILTGKHITFGNFCLIPYGMLHKLIYRSELWNNLPATIIRAGLPIFELATDRGRRFAGHSTMRMSSLIIHGLSAVSVYSDISLLRMLIAALILSVSAVVGIIVVFIIRLGTDLAIPNWASIVAGSLLIILIQAVMMSVFVILMILTNRSQLQVIPRKQFSDYIWEIIKIK